MYHNNFLICIEIALCYLHLICADKTQLLSPSSSQCLLQMGNYEEILHLLEQSVEAERDIDEFFNVMTRQLGGLHPRDITQSNLAKPGVLKTCLIGWLEKSCKILRNRRSSTDSIRTNLEQILKQNEQLVRENEELKQEKTQLQSSTIEAQGSVIRLQDELLKCKEDKLKEVSTVVEKAVQQTVQTEIKTYSQVVEKSAPRLTVKSVKTAIKEAAVEEDRSKRLIIFGLEEEKGEQLSDKVSNLFEHLGERPRQESVRLGRFEVGKNRPVKVKLPTSDHVHRILRQAKTLKQSSCYSSVFITPDRTQSEIEERPGIVRLSRKRFVMNRRNVTSSEMVSFL